jgi:hypothetical protein
MFTYLQDKGHTPACHDGELVGHTKHTQAASQPATQPASQPASQPNQTLQ